MGPLFPGISSVAVALLASAERTKEGNSPRSGSVAAPGERSNKRQSHTPWKINMEHFLIEVWNRKIMFLRFLSFHGWWLYVPAVNLPGCINRKNVLKPPEEKLFWEYYLNHYILWFCFLDLFMNSFYCDLICSICFWFVNLSWSYCGILRSS